MNKLILILLFLPLFSIGQGNFFWSHNSGIDVDMDFQTRETETAGDTFTAIATDNDVYLNTGVNHWEDSFGTDIDPSDDASSYPSSDQPDTRINFSSNSTIEGLYDRLMSATPYRSVWFEEGDNNPESGDKMVVPVNLFFNESEVINIGLIGDNYFSVSLNGTLLTELVVEDGGTYQDPYTAPFNYLNILEIPVSSGNANFTFTGIGDGSPDQTLGIIIWDNTKDELIGSSPISESEWDVLWSTDEIVNSTYATCPTSGYYYDDDESECVKVSDIDNWASGDDLLISFYVPSEFQSNVTNWTLKNGSGTILDSGTSYEENTVISGLSSGSNTFKYYVTTFGSVSIIEKTITL